MPAKLLRCIQDVMKQGKDKPTAIAMCVKSTGLKMEKKEVEKLLRDNEAKESFLEAIKEEKKIGFYEYKK